MHRCLLSIIVACGLLFACHAVRNEEDYLQGRNKRQSSKLHHPFTLTCANGRAISALQSLYSASHKDRSWTGQCKHQLLAPVTQSWTKYANVLKGNMYFTCPSGVVTGLASYHHSGYQDRQYKFRCGHMRCKKKYYCRWSVYTDWQTGWVTYIPSGYFVTGMKSDHSNGDRRFSLQYCSFISVC